MKDQKNTKLNEIEYSVDGIRSFIKSSGSGNTYFVKGFSSNSADVVDFTTDLSKIEKGLEELSRLKPKGNTSVFDAVSAAINKFADVKGKKALILISDGIDNASNISFKKLKQEIQESGVSIYLINCLRPQETETLQMPSARQLEHFVEESGGLAFFPSKREEATKSFEFLAKYIRFQYLLGFAPTRHKTKKWGKLSISIVTGSGRGDRVAQTGYYF